jgi:hypothetical protein
MAGRAVIADPHTLSSSAPAESVQSHNDVSDGVEDTSPLATATHHDHDPNSSRSLLRTGRAALAGSDEDAPSIPPLDSKVAAEGADDGGDKAIEGAPFSDDDIAAPIHVGTFCRHQRVGPCSQCLRPRVARVPGKGKFTKVLAGPDLPDKVVYGFSLTSPAPPKPTATHGHGGARTPRHDLTMDVIGPLLALGLSYREVGRRLGCTGVLIAARVREAKEGK